MLNQAWEKNYKKGRFNRYPYDSIVTFIMRNFSKYQDRSKIKILDLGCGGGNNLKFLKELGFDFRAVDGSPESIKLCKQFLELDEDDTRIVEANFCSLPYESEIFDAVIDRASLSCNKYEDICLIVNEIHRVLKKKGAYFGTDLYDINHPDLKYGCAIGNGDYDNFSEGNFFSAGQIHAFTPDELREIFSIFEEINIKKVKHEKLSEYDNIPIDISYELTATKNYI